MSTRPRRYRQLVRPGPSGRAWRAVHAESTPPASRKFAAARARSPAVSALQSASSSHVTRPPPAGARPPPRSRRCAANGPEPAFRRAPGPPANAPAQPAGRCRRRARRHGDAARWAWGQ
jgi:hypothetical protein